MNNSLKLFYLLVSLYFPVYVSIITDNNTWLFMWIFVFFVTIFNNDKDNGSNID